MIDTVTYTFSLCCSHWQLIVGLLLNMVEMNLNRPLSAVLANCVLVFVSSKPALVVQVLLLSCLIPNCCAAFCWFKLCNLHCLCVRLMVHHYNRYGKPCFRSLPISSINVRVNFYCFSSHCITPSNLCDVWNIFGAF